MSELRDSIKRWEHSFLEDHGRKPSPDDIRANAAVKDMYKRYHAAKRGQAEVPRAPLTPQKRRPDKHAPRKPEADDSRPDGEAAEADADTDVDDATPHQNKVTEIFPTPQFQGRALGIFDLSLSPPETPSKRRQGVLDAAQTPRTPSGAQQIIAETPMSKRTPEYFMYRTDIFNVSSSPSRGVPAPADSPLVKRKTMRAKSVSELVKEATELQNLQFEGQEELVQGTPSPPPADTPQPEAPAEKGAATSHSARTAEAAEVTGRVRKGPKRQTKRVLMRPINQSDLPSMAKPTENYKRLKINNNRGRRPFRRR